MPESGSGKTLSLLALLGLLPTGGIAGGSAMFRGRDLLSLDAKELREVRGKEDRRRRLPGSDELVHPMLTIGRQLVLDTSGCTGR